MNAEYTTSLLYPGNPYVEALPPMLAGQELIRALASVPLYSTSDRDRSTGERLQLLSALYEFYQPLTMTLDLYCEVYNAMQHCYGQYTPQREATALQQGYAAMQGKAVAASIGGGNSFCCWCVRAWQVNGIAAGFVFVSLNYPSRTLQRSNALLPANPLSGRTDPARRLCQGNDTGHIFAVGRSVGHKLPALRIGTQTDLGCASEPA